VRHDLRLALPVLVAWVMAAILIEFPRALWPAAIVLWLISAAVLVVSVRYRGGSGLLWLALALALSAMVVSVAAVRSPSRQPTELIEAADAGRHVVATVTAEQRVVPGSPFEATLNDVRIGRSERAVRIPVTVFVALHDPLRAPVGAELTVDGTLGSEDPGDSAAFRLFASHGAHRVAGPPGYLAWAAELRAAFGRVAADLPGDGGALLPGLAIGDTSAVGDSLDTAMKSSSLSHLTAVSGANCAVVIALILLAGARMRLPRWLRIAGAAAMLLAFVVLVTPQPSVLRAAVMAAIVLAAHAVGRPVSALPVLALATLVLIAIDPWLSRDYGFVLSVLATAGLLLLARPLGSVLTRWMPGWLATVIAVPLAAQLACQPVLILLNPTIPTYGVLANVLAEPAAPVATVLGLIACVLSLAAPPLGMLAARVAWLPAGWIAGVARFFSGLPGSALPWPGGVPGVAIVALISCLVFVFALRLGGRRGRTVTSALLAVIVTCYAGIVIGDRARSQLSLPQTWQIAACDIGQGDAVLVRSLGSVALIDTGPEPKRLATCLQRLGIRHIDLLILSHYDLDHVGGTSAVFGMVTRAMIGPTADANDERLAEQLATHGAKVEHVSQGLTGSLGELGWRVLWPKNHLGGVSPGNDASVTVRFDGVGRCADGCLSAVFLGDLGEQPQGLVLAANPSLAASTWSK
jgi:competence protein ComEC